MLASVAVWLSIARRLAEARPLVPYEPRLRVPWKVADVIWLALAWLILDAVALRLAISSDALRRGNVTPAALVAVTVSHSVWAVLALVYLGVRCRGKFRQAGFDTSRLGDDARLGGLAFLAAAPLVYGMQFVVSQFWEPLEHPLAKMITSQPGGWLLAVAAVSAVVVAPMSEELMFRVVMQGWLERSARRWRRFGPLWRPAARWLPILMSSTLFAAMHQGADRVALFVLALVLGYLYRQTHRIYPPLVMHACVNALAVVGLALGVK